MLMFVQFILIIDALLTTACGASFSSLVLRGRALNKDEIGKSDGFDEKLGQCKGAICGLWGDPHIITCDGLAYDCQGEGIFTFMRNHWFNIQGYFVDVGAAEIKKVLGWNNYPRATVTNDVMIAVEDENMPTFQFTFPDLSAHDGTVPSEEGCLVGLHYQPFNMERHGRSTEPSLQRCRERCERIEGCVQFSYFGDGGCHPQDDTSSLVETPKGWSRSVAGPVHKCGKELARTQFTKDFPFAKVFSSNNDRRQLQSTTSHLQRRLGRSSSSDDSKSRSKHRSSDSNSNSKSRSNSKSKSRSNDRSNSRSNSNSNSNSKSRSNSNSKSTSRSNDRSNSRSNSSDNSKSRSRSNDFSSDDRNEGQGQEAGNGCPFLFYVDGEMKDISRVPNNGYLYGDARSDASAKLEGTRIRVSHKTPTGSYSEAMLEVAGQGPGELWGCHWQFWVCLPEDQEELFESETVGLFGSPDGNTQNDWMDITGQPLAIPSDERGKGAFEYCHENWCVSQEDSLMTYPEGTTYEDHKCVNKEYVPFDVENEDCIISADKIIEKCAEKPNAMIASCQLECCYGGCNMIDHIEEELVDLDKLQEDTEEEDIVYDPPPLPPPMCEEDGSKSLTSDSVCPNSENGIVQIIHKSSDELPVGDHDILYGIVLEEAKDDNVGTSVKFKVDNIFAAETDIYVRYERKIGEYANEPACEAMPNTMSGCDVNAKSIEVGCIQFPDLDPFALVDLYFVSNKPNSFINMNAADDTVVHKCCKPPDAYNVNEYGVVKYTLKIQCACPDDGESI